MDYIKNLAIEFLNLSSKLTGNKLAQRFLEYNVIVAQYLMGIGSGSSPESSGEKVIVAKLKQRVHLNLPLCIFDVGANKGQFLQMIRTGLKDIPAYIHAFEPSAFTYEILRESVGHLPNIYLNNFGLGKCSGETELFYDEAASGLASLSKRRLDHLKIDFKLSEKIRIETLDDYCSKLSISRLDLLKLDVEGHEMDVLEGGAGMFENRCVKMVSFEFGGCNIDSRTFFQDFFYFFKKYEMSNIFRLTPSGYLAPIHRYQELYEQFRTTNFLVFPDG